MSASISDHPETIPPHKTTPPRNSMECSGEEVKYTKVATAMRLKVRDDDEEDHACGELVHVVPDTPLTPSNKTLDIPVLHATGNGGVPSNVDEVKGDEISPTVHSGSLKNLSACNVNKKLLSKQPEKAAEAPAGITLPTTYSIATTLVKKATSKSVDGIYDLLGSEDESTGGLDTEEKIMSIEMLVSDMCKSLDSINVSGAHETDDVVIAISEEPEGEEGRRGEDGEGVDGNVSPETNEVSSDDVEGPSEGEIREDDHFYINVDL